jgi:hypothetical protein
VARDNGLARRYTTEWLLALRALWPWRFLALVAIELATVVVAVLTGVAVIAAAGPLGVMAGAVLLIPRTFWSDQRKRADD